MIQISLELEDSTTALRDAAFGAVVVLNDGHYIVLKPVAKLLNSTMIQEIVRRGDSLVAHVETGKLTVRKSSTPCKIVKATLSVKV